MSILIILLITLLIASLSKAGGITPYIAGGVGIAYSSITRQPYEVMLGTAVLLYFISYLGNTWAEVEDKSMTQMVPLSKGSQPFPLFLLKVITLSLFTLLPIPKPPFYIQGIVAIIIVAGLYSTTLSFIRDYFLANVFLLMIVMTIAGLLFNRFSTHSSYTLALIAAVAIPRLLCPPKHYTSLTSIYIEDQQPSFRALAAGFLLTYFTPGYSTNLIAKSLFTEGIGASIGNTIIEAAIEGWALQIALNSQITTKSVLGDLLSLPELEWDTFSPHTSLKLVLACLPLLAALISALTPALKVDIAPIVPCTILTIQAVITAGFIETALFVTIGFYFYSKDPDLMSLSFLNVV